MTTPACVIDAGTIIEDFNDASEWTVSSSSDIYNVFDSEMTKEPGGRACGVGRKTNTNPAYIQKTINIDLSTLYTPSMSLTYFTGWDDMFNASSSGLSTLAIEFSSTSDFSKSFKYTMPKWSNAGHQRMQIGSTEWVNTGGESWSNTMIRLRVWVLATYIGNMRVFHFDELRGGVVTTPYVSIVMYASYLGQYTHGFPSLTSRGLKGTLFPSTVETGRQNVFPTEPPALPGSSGWDEPRFEWADLVEMYEAGFPVGVLQAFRYDDDHYKQEEQCEQVIIENWQTAIDDLNSHGIEPIPVARTGVGDHRTIPIMKNLGFVACLWGGGAESDVDTPIEDVFQIRTRVIEWPMTLDDAKGLVDDAKAAGRSLVLMFEDIDDTATHYYWGEHEFADLLDYIIAQDIDIVTIPELYTLTTGETFRTPPAVPVNTNLEMFAGDSSPISFNIPRNLSGCSVSWVISEGPGEAPLVVKSPAIINEYTGEVEAAMLLADTALLNGIYYHEAQVTDAFNLVQTLVYGRFKIRPTSTT